MHKINHDETITYNHCRDVCMVMKSGGIWLSLLSARMLRKVVEELSFIRNRKDSYTLVAFPGMQGKVVSARLPQLTTRSVRSSRAHEHTLHVKEQAGGSAATNTH